ncbi:hypothetical protein CDL15_Pgr006481 [Punica granatum]|uniref:Uncharacterized protein n=1 Tax=Punica granatum TaxID=22663 RepID=A0A218XZB7_PUNGR|nr:hypothetical protein CDL15_Pgr006481 [Punica granatum]
MKQKYNSERDEQDPVREIEKLALVSRNFEIGELGEPSPENRKNSPDPDGFNSGEAQIDHGEASAVSRTVTGVHSSPHCGVQRREPPPAASSPPFPTIPIDRRLTGLGPFLLLRRFGPNRPNTLQSGPASLSSGFSFGRAIRSNPIRPNSSSDFFLFLQRSPSTFRTR